MHLNAIVTVAAPVKRLFGEQADNEHWVCWCDADRL